MRFTKIQCNHSAIKPSFYFLYGVLKGAICDIQILGARISQANMEYDNVLTVLATTTVLTELTVLPGWPGGTQRIAWKHVYFLKVYLRKQRLRDRLTSGLSCAEYMDSLIQPLPRSLFSSLSHKKKHVKCHYIHTEISLRSWAGVFSSESYSMPQRLTLLLMLSWLIWPGFSGETLAWAC